ncbi:MAG: CaiB/BaiF CoA transferase family protein [Acidimicrobiia bacterium]
MGDTLPLSSIKVLEVASWVFVPAAGAVLAEWGAEVIKVENASGGDPQRGLVSSGFVPSGSVNHLFEIPNRGKKSVAVDLKHPEGREVVLEIARNCDVFTTNLLPQQRSGLGLDVEDIRSVNSRIVYAIGSGTGESGPEAGKGGFDLSTYWARSLASSATPPGVTHPVNMPAAGFGDLTAGLALAGGIALALFHRERTGQSVVVDNSLLGTAAWSAAINVIGAAVTGREAQQQWNRRDAPNPLVNYYRTSDERFLHLNMLQADRWWPDLARALGRPDLASDPRWVERPRGVPAPQIVDLLDEIFATRSLSDWCEALSCLSGGAVWEPVKTPSEVAVDPQLRANSLIREISVDGAAAPIVAAPVRIAGSAEPNDRCAPGLGEHTDDVLLGLGFTMEQVIDLKISGALL